MTQPTLTYRILFDRLKRLGYTSRISTLDGEHPQVILEHPDHERAMIMLPQRPLDDPVLPHHAAAVQVILTTHGLVEPADPGQVLLQMLERNRKSPTSAS